MEALKQQRELIRQARRLSREKVSQATMEFLKGARRQMHTNHELANAASSSRSPLEVVKKAE